jgi:hypothetical protein
MERTYLDLINGKPNIDKLQRYADLVDERVRYDVSRELNSFFYLQTPEEYYASEHEVIWMHLLLSWGYSMRKDYESGCVEARRASYFLSSSWSEEGRFDDPSLRIVAGYMWALCGDWDEAVVDFRAAQRLSPELEWLKPLSERKSPPQNLIVGFGGGGPEPRWNPELNGTLLRSLRGIDFKYTGAKSDLQILANHDVALPTYRGPLSAPWYQRHIERDNAIHELIDDSRYGGEVLGYSSVSAAEISANVAVGGAWIAGGTVLGAGLIYLGVNGESADVVLLGATIIAVSVKAATQFVSERSAQSVARTKEKLDYSKHYRFVRYLPEYLWLSWGDENEQQMFDVYLKGTPIKTITAPIASHQDKNIYFFFYPDVNQRGR